MKLKLGVFSLNIVVGAREAEHLASVLNSPDFHLNFKSFLAQHGLLVIGEIAGNGVMSEGTIEYHEPRISLN